MQNLVNETSPHATVLLFSIMEIDWKYDIAIRNLINKLSREDSNFYFGY